MFLISYTKERSVAINVQKMKAVRLHAPGDLRVEEIDIPRPGDHQVLVKVRAVGVCGSDPGRVMKRELTLTLQRSGMSSLVKLLKLDRG